MCLLRCDETDSEPRQWHHRLVLLTRANYRLDAGCAAVLSGCCIALYFNDFFRLSPARKLWIISLTTYSCHILIPTGLSSCQLQLGETGSSNDDRCACLARQTCASRKVSSTVGEQLLCSIFGLLHSLHVLVRSYISAVHASENWETFYACLTSQSHYSCLALDLTGTFVQVAHWCVPRFAFKGPSSKKDLCIQH